MISIKRPFEISIRKNNVFKTEISFRDGNDGVWNHHKGKTLKDLREFTCHLNEHSLRFHEIVMVLKTLDIFCVEKNLDKFDLKHCVPSLSFKALSSKGAFFMRELGV